MYAGDAVKLFSGSIERDLGLFIRFCGIVLNGREADGKGVGQTLVDMVDLRSSRVRRLFTAGPRIVDLYLHFERR